MLIGHKCHRDILVDEKDLEFSQKLIYGKKYCDDRIYLVKQKMKFSKQEMELFCPSTEIRFS